MASGQRRMVSERRGCGAKCNPKRQTHPERPENSAARSGMIFQAGLGGDRDTASMKIRLVYSRKTSQNSLGQAGGQVRGSDLKGKRRGPTQQSLIHITIRQRTKHPRDTLHTMPSGSKATSCLGLFFCIPQSKLYLGANVLLCRCGCGFRWRGNMCPTT